jgi:site-specific recombinase XerD
MSTTTELVVTERHDKLPALQMTANDYASCARAASTAKAYTSALKHFNAWCSTNGRDCMPALQETIADYLTWRANAGKKVSTMSVELSAIVAAHKLSGFELDTKVGTLAATWSGIRRECVKETRQAAPLTKADLSALLDMIDDGIMGVRDRALLAFGLVSGRRRSELAGLDLEHAGGGRGFIRIGSAGVEIILLKSKSSQSAAKVFAIPRGDAPKAIAALERWIDVAGIQPGTPVFRGINNAGRVLDERLSDLGVSRAIKRWMKRLGKDEAAFSGHSLRVGFAVEAINGGAQFEHVANHLGHSSVDMTRHYAKTADKWSGKATSKVGI